MLRQHWTLTRKMRVPAISRLQKIHNTEVYFETLSASGLDLSTVRGKFTVTVQYPSDG